MVPRCATGWRDSKVRCPLSLNVDKLVLVHCDAHQGIELLQRTLADEVFALFELTHDNEFRYTPLDGMISRIKEIYSSTDPFDAFSLCNSDFWYQLEPSKRWSKRSNMFPEFASLRMAVSGGPTSRIIIAYISTGHRKSD
jgi:hypothetical protein